MASRPIDVSERYSFRFNGDTLIVYNLKDDNFKERLSMKVGGYFSWHDNGSSYVLTLKEIVTNEVRVAALTEQPNMPGPSPNSGNFELTTHILETGEKTIVEVYVGS